MGIEGNFLKARFCSNDRETGIPEALLIYNHLISIPSPVERIAAGEDFLSSYSFIAKRGPVQQINDNILLSVDNVSKRFGGLTALKGVTFHVKEGEVLGLMGPNGAGKTTLLNVIAGELAPDTGTIKFKGHDISGMSPYKICRMGISRTFQIPQPFVTLSVRENLLTSAMFGRQLRKKEALSDDDMIFDLVGLSERKETLAGNMPTLLLKKLELARALARKPELLLLDEVAAGTTEAEIPAIIERVKKIRSMGITIIIIEHVIKVLMNVVDRIVVIDKGIPIAEGMPSAIMCDNKVINAYFGA
jgi:branched-chain amino acid transport system ATP-binding protein